CSDTKINDTSYLDYNTDNFPAVRAVHAKMMDLENVDLKNVHSYMVNGESGEQLIALAKKAIEEKKLIVFLFHGVGGGHNLDVSVEAHNALLKYLKEHEENIWIAPMIEVAKFIISYRKNR